MSTNQLYIGLMSGTSIDGIDAALVDFNDQKPALIASHYEKFSDGMRRDILALCAPGADEINRLATLDVALGKKFAEAANILLQKNNLAAKSIHAIGSHGQTIRHHPEKKFTLQIGDPNIIAAETGITTVADFRRRDIAHGGQGAPLVPAFHQEIFSSQKNPRAIVNIGGIANVTLLLKKVSGFDTGPGNTLLDAWIEKHTQSAFDKNGEWAAKGRVQKKLLDALLNDPYFSLSPPKSTGREYFNLAWLQSYFTESFSPVDVQATLVELTAQSILRAIHHFPEIEEIFICGGGAKNNFLMERVKQLATNYSVATTEKLGVDPDWVEAIAFAWLAKQTLEKKAGNLVAVTGAKAAAVLGGVYFV